MVQTRTKIVCTLGPACAHPATIRRMVSAGMNVARINLSHGSHADYARWIHLVRDAARVQARRVAILLDLRGPKMRIGAMKQAEGVTLRRGGAYCLTTRRIKGDAHAVSTTYAQLPKDVEPGDPILLDDGRIELEVLKIQGRDVHCKVCRGGILRSNKGINLPGVALSAPTLTPKDLDDLAFGVRAGMDYVALSFVRTVQDVQRLREWLRRHHYAVPIIAKIERAEALERLDEILGVTDGVMVARGDLGVELSLTRVPVLQKMIIERANRAGRLVITATQMLESMIDNAVPTRAEATDIANAIFDHTDGVMLSGETAAGRYPVEAVRMMASVISEAEQSAYLRPAALRHPGLVGHTVTQAVVQAAAQAAEQPYVKALMVFTMTGTTVQALSKYRPTKPIYGLSNHPQVVRRMALHWGVEPFLISSCRTTDHMITSGERLLLREGRLKKGDVVVVVAGASMHKGATNMMKFLRV